MAWWTGQPVYGSNPVSKFIRENFAYLKTYVDYITNSGVTTADLAAVHASPPSLGSIVNITVNTTIGNTDVGLGGGYNISGGIVLTISGAFSAPRTQIFFGAGTVTFNHYANIAIEVYPEWWGAKADGIVDCTTPIISAINSIYAGVIQFGPGVYKVTDTITISKAFINIRGLGQRGGTTIRFVPTSGKSCLVYDGGAAGLVFSLSLRDIEFSSGVVYGNFTKVAIETMNTSQLLIENVGITLWNGNNASVGIKLGGREFTTLKFLQIEADIPLKISQNPYRAFVGFIDIDHSHLTDLYLIATVGPAINIDTGVNLTNVHFDGHQSWVTPTKGLYWNDTTTTGTSNNLSIYNARLEQETVNTDYMIEIVHNFGLRSLIINNCYGGAVSRGIRLRKCSKVTIQNHCYPNAANNEALNVSNSVYDLVLINNFFQAGTTATMTGQKLLWGVTQQTGPLPTSAIYTSTLDTFACSTITDVPLEGFSITLDNAAKGLLVTDNFAGTAFITSNLGASTMYAINGLNHSVGEGYDALGHYNNTEGAPAVTNIYWDAGNNRYELENNQGATYTYHVTLIGMYLP